MVLRRIQMSKPTEIETDPSTLQRREVKIFTRYIIYRIYYSVFQFRNKLVMGRLKQSTKRIVKMFLETSENGGTQKLHVS